jgi:toxin secretion/phage lysis holin
MSIRLEHALATVLAVIVSLLGGWSPVLAALAVLQCLDIVSGITVAAKTGQVSSKIGWAGLAKKLGTWIAIAVLSLVEGLTGPELHLRDGGAIWYCAVEAISVTENLGEAGVPLPGILTDAIAVLKGKGEPAR